MNYGTTYSQDVANFAGVSVSVDHNNDIETDQVNEDSELAHSDRSKGQRVSSSAIVVSEKLDSTVRKRRNKILFLEDADGTRRAAEDDLHSLAKVYVSQLFTTQGYNEPSSVLAGISPCIRML
ncbi:hypothetical protein V6N11_030618 [Hibiscus sabdariffa]|uniref:Uncharacterized protein n=2 Tax=Hibiscus sabdariffa TaxID=183260 RepID=A0ABR1ZHD0_9ROSI